MEIRGDNVITVKEIAKMCNVSASTVSNILNGKPNVGEATRQRVLEVVRETGYQPNYYASNMRRRSTRTISIIAEDLGQFSTVSILEAALAYCEERDYRTVIMNLRMYDKWKDTWYNDENKLLNTLTPVLNELLSIKVDGVIYIAGHGRIIKCLPEDFALPTVVAYGASENNRFPSVILEDERGGYEMMKYLTSMGHKRIGIVAGMADNVHTAKRLLGCQKALFEAGIPYNPEWTKYGDWERTSGYICTRELVKNGVTAIWCMNDIMAGGAYDYAHEHGLQIGKELSIAGYDNRQIAEFFYPRLTTNELPLAQIGKTAAQILLKTLNETSGSGEEQAAKEAEDNVVMVGGKMIIGDSVCRLA